MIYRINDIFYSLQGEGIHTGEPAVFVRFSGCNLKCPWCDTDFSSATEMTAEEIVERGCRLWKGDNNLFVIFTGGEPSLQVDATLIDAFHKKNAFIAIETNGTCELPNGIDWITCSPKPKTRLKLSRANEVKVVFDGSTNPELWRKEIEAPHWLLQPLDKDHKNNVEQVLDYILAHPTWRLSVQLHKMLNIK